MVNKYGHAYVAVVRGRHGYIIRIEGERKLEFGLVIRMQLCMLKEKVTDYICFKLHKELN